MDDRYGIATYDLDELKVLLSNEATRIVTETEARHNARELGFVTDDEIIEQCMALEKKNIYKTMPSTSVPGSWQDVYRRTCRDIPCYIKLSLNFSGKGVVVQFKRDTSI